VTHGFDFDVSHMLAGCLVLASFAMLYQDRLYALINVLAVHALILTLSVAWQAHVQQAPHLYITAAIALGFKASSFPWRCGEWCTVSASTGRSKRW
jgi:hydrogenase-4 component E